MEVTYASLYKFVDRNIKRTNGEKTLLETKDGMGIEFPGYRLSPCELEEGEFATLFLDMRGSTTRTRDYGRKIAAVTLHAFLPTLAHIVKSLNGFVVDYPGDGIMAHWEEDGQDPGGAIVNATIAAGWMDDAVKNIVNPLLLENQIPTIQFGIGIAMGTVTITNLGIPGAYAHKAIGDSVNWASKLANNKEHFGAILIDDLSSAKGFIPVSPTQIPLASIQFNTVIIDGRQVRKITEMAYYKLPRPTPEDSTLEEKAKRSNLVSTLSTLGRLVPSHQRGLIPNYQPLGLLGPLQPNR